MSLNCETFGFFLKYVGRGASVARSVALLGFGSGHDLIGCGMEPHVRFLTPGECARQILSLPPAPCLPK